MRRIIAPLLLVVAACARQQPAPSTGKGAMQTEIHVAWVGQRPGPPPLTLLLGDFAPHNDAAEPRWVLIPSHLPAGSGGVDKLERIGPWVGQLLGGGGCYALRLAPGARAVLRNLEVRWWRQDDLPAPPLDVRVAHEVRAGEVPLAAWFDGEPTISGSVVIDLAATAHAAGHGAPGGREVPLAAPDARTVSFRLSPE